MRPLFRALSAQQTPDSDEDDTKESNNISCNQATHVLNIYIYIKFSERMSFYNHVEIMKFQL